MNSMMAKLMAGLGRNPEEESDKLVRLRNQLAQLGVHAELRDNNSALMVHRPKPGMPVWVFVGYGGAFYSWQSAEQRHATSDPVGAAHALAEYVAR